MQHKYNKNSEEKREYERESREKRQGEERRYRRCVGKFNGTVLKNGGKGRQAGRQEGRGKEKERKSICWQNGKSMKTMGKKERRQDGETKKRRVCVGKY